MAGPRAAGGRSQPPAQPGRLAGGRARFHPLLPGRGVLSAPGTAPSVCFNSWLCLLYLPLPGRLLESFVPPESSNHHPEATFWGVASKPGVPPQGFLQLVSPEVLWGGLPVPLMWGHIHPVLFTPRPLLSLLE